MKVKSGFPINKEAAFQYLESGFLTRRQLVESVIDVGDVRIVAHGLVPLVTR
jgi:hypothetical protein